ncbi:MAG: pilin [Alcanivoracaceae bacterium]|nr:pilin [Alcanivoracaceae bacterium]
MATIGLKRFHLASLLALIIITLLLTAAYWLAGRGWISQWHSDRQLAHALQRSEAVQQPLREFIQRTGFWPNSALDARLDENLLQADDTIEEIRIGNSSLLIVTFANQSAQLAGHTLIFIPEKLHQGEIRWRCEGGTLPQELRPASCRSSNPTVAKTLTTGQLPTLPTPVREALEQHQDPLLRRAEKVRQILADRVRADRGMRKKISRFFQQNGVPATSNEQIGLPEAHRSSDPNFRRFGLESNGAILYEFSNAIAGMEGYRFRLVPTGLPGVWRCETSLPEDHIPELCGQQVL